MTPDRIKAALETYQNCVQEYGPVEEEGFPLSVNIKKIVPIRPLLKGLSEVFADPSTGIGADLMDIDPNAIDQTYYEKCAEHLRDVMRNEQREYETAQQKALEKYSELDKPFYLHSGISKDVFDYIEFYILFLAILCVAIAAPTFAGEYQTGGDSILRTTKHGRTRLAVTKILAAFTLFIVTFLVGITVHILILNVAFGTHCLKTSFQMLYSIADYDRQYYPLIEDCIQDAFVEAILKYDDYKHYKNPMGWIARVAGNRLKSEIRKEKGHQKTISSHLQIKSEDMAFFTDDVEKEIEHTALKEDILRIYQMLTDLEKIVFHEYFLNEKTVKDVATSSGLSENSVRAAIRRIRKRSNSLKIFAIILLLRCFFDNSGNI